MALKRRPRYEDTGARKCRKMFHAKVEHEYAKLRTISRLRDSADREKFSLDKRGDVMGVEAPQNQEKFHEGSPAAETLYYGSDFFSC
ncbi:unnamed protein product [Cylicocyclus nassatus]|uniref:Uncharacterized protein n=1 Tax=Cylicocyclus nassatus TaxID=53992 RepID=A0AA36DVZ1_CYLNA|nr:unnamed protein product [Cylicocyclus nassatus]